jgi:hypothetical protein
MEAQEQYNKAANVNFDDGNMDAISDQFNKLVKLQKESSERSGYGKANIEMTAPTLPDE